MTSIPRRAFALLLAALIPAAAGAAAPSRGPAVTYLAPAGTMPAGRLRLGAFDAVLPSGRLVTPAGTSVAVGSDALGVALTPDGRFAVVSNDDEHDSSLAVVDTTTMNVVDRYQNPGAAFYAGIVAVPDPGETSRTLVLAAGGAGNDVRAFTLDRAGRLTPDQVPSIPLPGVPAAGFAEGGLSFPSALVAEPDGRRVYVAEELGNAVAGIDTASRRVIEAPAAVGYRPAALALAGTRLLVADAGLMRYAVLPSPAQAPPFRAPAADLQRASALSLLALAPSGAPVPDTPPFVPMDPTPDGVANVGGAQPTGIAATPNGAYAFVAMANVDRIAVVALRAAPHVVGGLELRLFDRGPYGTEPTALALSRDGSRLYVALSGLNAVAVIDARDPLHLRRLGLIPTGWAPSALALSRDDRELYVVNARGTGAGTGSTFERIPLGAIRLIDSTRAALTATRRVVTAAPAYPKEIRNVVLILLAGRTFDAVFGDMGYGPADASLCTAPAAVTPNLHALARRYALAGNFFSDGADASEGHQYADAGIASAYSMRHAGLARGRGAFTTGQDPEDYPRAGYLFNALARHDLSFRDYGELLLLAGYTPEAGYPLDVPAPAVLADRVDPRYPGWNPQVRDAARADEFVRDAQELPEPPRLSTIWLSGSDPADTDAAVGKIVDFLSHRPAWRTTAVLIEPVAAEGRDHVDEHRSFALIASPWAKSGYVGMRHVSSASIVKTIDGLLDLPPLTLGDLLATDMSDFFTNEINPLPYEALGPSGRS